MRDETVHPASTPGFLKKIQLLLNTVKIKDGNVRQSHGQKAPKSLNTTKKFQRLNPVGHIYHKLGITDQFKYIKILGE